MAAGSLDSRICRLTLIGRVASFYEKQLLQEVLKKIDQVDELKNEVVVYWSE